MDHFYHALGIAARAFHPQRKIENMTPPCLAYRTPGQALATGLGRRNGWRPWHCPLATARNGDAQARATPTEQCHRASFRSLFGQGGISGRHLANQVGFEGFFFVCLCQMQYNILWLFHWSYGTYFLCEILSGVYTFIYMFIFHIFNYIQLLNHILAFPTEVEKQLK